MKLTNLTNANMDFVTGVKDGALVTESLAPRETRDIKVRENDPTLVARLHAGSVRAEGAKAAPKADKPAA